MKNPKALKVVLKTVMYLKFDELGTIEEILDKNREGGECEVVEVAPATEEEYKRWLE